MFDWKKKDQSDFLYNNPEVADKSKAVYWDGGIWFLAKYLSLAVGLPADHASLYFRHQIEKETVPVEQVTHLNFNHAHKFRKFFREQTGINLSVMEDYLLIYESAGVDYLKEFLPNFNDNSSSSQPQLVFFYDDLDIVAIENKDEGVVACFRDYSDLFPKCHVRVLISNSIGDLNSLKALALRPLSDDEIMLNLY